MNPTIEVRDLTKRFPGVVAMAGVSARFFPGRVHALLGENGAGKSTLVKMLSGIYTPDGGEILVDGTPTALNTPRSSEKAGIAVVHQHRTLVDDLSVGENLFLGQLGAGWAPYSSRRWAARSRELLSIVGLDIDPSTPVRTLGPAAQQMVEVGRALSRDAKTIVFDEPTTSLTPPEREVLFQLVRGLRDRGIAIIYISHDLEDTLALSDDLTVLRDGRVALSADASVGVPAVVQSMIGRALEEERPHRRIAHDEEVLRVEDVTADRIRGVSLTVRRGEIVCIAGLVGSGRTELLRSLYGLDRITGGHVLFRGREHRPRSPKHSIRRGIGMVTEDRKSQGLVLELSVAANVSLGNEWSLARGGFLSLRKVRDLARRTIESLRIKTPDTETMVGLLSGGNQQKVILGRWLARRTDLLLIDEPTVGIDVGARSEFYKLLDDYAASGGACLVVSSDLGEVLELADRVVVLRAGRSTGEMEGNDMTRENILRAMTVGTA